jgi:hypothetical protein
MKRPIVRTEAPHRPPPSAAERVAIDRAVTDVAAREPRFQIDLKQAKDGSIERFGGPHNDYHGWRTRFENLFGSRGDDFAINQLNHLMSMCRDGDGKINVVAVNAALAMIEAAKPQNELQAALAVQMAMTHSLTTQAIRRAARVDQIPQFDSAGNMAVKLARTFTMQAEALAKLQRGGEQIVKVVHVHSGAQAVIGNVTSSGTMVAGVAVGAGGPGGGGCDETDNQPHAKGRLPAPSAAPMPEMQREDARGSAVSLAGGRR